MADDSDWVRRAQTDDSRTPAELIAAYREGPVLVRDAVAGMNAEALRARPIPAKMSTLEVIGHIADSEQYLADRLKRTIATDKPLLMGVNGILYLEALRYHDRDVELQLRLIETTREQMAADLDRLAEDSWTREAIHSEVGLVTLRKLLLHAIRHLESHVAAVQEKRDALGL